MNTVISINSKGEKEIDWSELTRVTLQLVQKVLMTKTPVLRRGSLGDAEDFTQQLLMKWYGAKYIENYDEAKCRDFYAYLKVAVVRHMIDTARATNRMVKTVTTDVEGEDGERLELVALMGVSKEKNPLEVLLRKEIEQVLDDSVVHNGNPIVLKTIDWLPEARLTTATVWKMYVGGYTGTEIAKMFNERNTVIYNVINEAKSVVGPLLGYKVPA